MMNNVRRLKPMPLSGFLPALATRNHWTTRPVKPRKDADEVWENDRAHFVHPWTHFESFKSTGSLIFGKAEGPYVYDLDGRPYLDGIAGLWCVNAGYGRKEIVQAMAEQAFALPYYNTFSDTGNIPAANLAKKLAEYTPEGLDKVFFTVCGSTANDTAVRLAHYYFGKQGKSSKKHIISRTDAYHGSTYVAGSITGKLSDRSPYLHYVTEWIHHLSSPNYDRAHEIAPNGTEMTESEFCDWLLAEFEQKILTLGPDNVAMFFAEPLLGSGGVIIPPPGYIKRTRELCTKYDILYVSDEVVTGFGRIGHIFSSEAEFGIRPDMIISAKGLSSGYAPLAACIFSQKIYDIVSGPDTHAPKNKKIQYSASGDHPLGVFTNGYTYSGHPVSTAAGLANLQLFERDRLCDHVNDVGPYLEDKLRTLQDLPIVGAVRGKKFMMCVENVMNKRTKEYFPQEVSISKKVADNCEAVGLIVRPIGPLNIISPPLILDKQHIDELIMKLRQAYMLTIADLFKEGHLK